MFSHFSYPVALRFILKKNSKWPTFTGLVSIIGVACGVAAFLVVITVFNSFENRLRTLLMAANPQLIIFKFPDGIPNVDSEIEFIKSETTYPIQSMSRFEYTEAILTKDAQSTTVILKGVEGKEGASYSELKHIVNPPGVLDSFSTSLVEQRLQTQPDEVPPVLLGKVLAQKINAVPGDVVQFTFGGLGTSSSKVAKFKVTGLLQIGLAQYDDRLAIVSFADARKHIGTPGMAKGIEVSFVNPDHALPFAKKLRSILPYSVKAWQEIDQNLFAQIERDGSTIQFIVFIITLVAGFNIVVTLNLSVLDRAKQIAILRSLGASRGAILRLFVWMGLILGVVGSLVGMIFGLMILFLFSNFETGELQSFYWVDKIPVQYEPKLFVMALLMSVVLSFLSSLYPAFKATKVSPLTGLKSS